jgi:hypothetical protein
LFLLKVASVLKVSTLKDWIFKSYSKGFLNKGLEGLKSVCSLFLFSRPQNDETSQNLNNENTPKTPSSAHSNDNFDFTKNLFASSQDAPNIESIQFKRDKEIEAEILFFSDRLSDENKIRSIKSTTQFWKENKKDLPHLFELQLILLNIPASSSFIERFFSISGIVCDVRRGSMNDDLIEMRSMMKANMHVLEQLNKIGIQK